MSRHHANYLSYKNSPIHQFSAWIIYKYLIETLFLPNAPTPLPHPIPLPITIFLIQKSSPLVYRNAQSSLGVFHLPRDSAGHCADSPEQDRIKQFTKNSCYVGMEQPFLFLNIITGFLANPCVATSRMINTFQLTDRLKDWVWDALECLINERLLFVKSNNIFLFRKDVVLLGYPGFIPFSDFQSIGPLGRCFL